MDMNCFSMDVPLLDITRLQSIAIVTSILSLTFTFSKHFAMKQNGALEFGTAYILILLSTIMQIIGRIVCFTLFAYTFGMGNIWPAMVFIVGHIILIATFQITFDYKIWKDLKKRDFLEFIFNGVANIYLHNQIIRYDGKRSEERRVNALELGQTLVFECIMILENIAMAVTVSIYFRRNRLVLVVIWLSFLLYIIGFALRLLYFKFFYIWKNIVFKDLHKLKSELKSKRQVRKRQTIRQPEGTELQSQN